MRFLILGILLLTVPLRAQTPTSTHSDSKTILNDTQNENDTDPSIWVAPDGFRAVVWHGDEKVYYRSSGDGGLTWGAQWLLKLGNTQTLSPRITGMADGRMLAMWSEGHPVMRYSENFGEAWAPAVDVPIPEPSFFISLEASTSGTLVLVFKNYSTGPFYFSRSSFDSLSAWSRTGTFAGSEQTKSSPKMVATDNQGKWLMVCTTNSNALKAWISVDDGRTWSVDSEFGATSFPSISGGVTGAVVGAGENGDWRITWGSTEYLSDSRLYTMGSTGLPGNWGEPVLWQTGSSVVQPGSIQNIGVSYPSVFYLGDNSWGYISNSRRTIHTSLYGDYISTTLRFIKDNPNSNYELVNDTAHLYPYKVDAFGNNLDGAITMAYVSNLQPGPDGGSDDELYVRSSSDRGMSWTPAFQLNAQSYESVDRTHVRNWRIYQ